MFLEGTATFLSFCLHKNYISNKLSTQMIELPVLIYYVNAAAKSSQVGSSRPSSRSNCSSNRADTGEAGSSGVTTEGEILASEAAVSHSAS